MNSVQILNHPVNTDEDWFQIGHIGVRWNLLDDVYTRLTQLVPVPVVGMRWNHHDDAYLRPETEMPVPQVGLRWNKVADTYERLEE